MGGEAEGQREWRLRVLHVSQDAHVSCELVLGLALIRTLIESVHVGSGDELPCLVSHMDRLGQWWCESGTFKRWSFGWPVRP